MLVSIMITTRNRLSELQRTCRILKTLDPAPSEILITADGCSDGTVRYLRDSCPEFHLIVHDISRGSVASGAAMMEKAPGDLVLALDDDSYPEQSDCLNTLSDLFSQNARVAVATLPQRTDEYPETLTRKDFGSPPVGPLFCKFRRMSTGLDLPLTAWL
jgi:glycosyltransferase involved in cell wall biosynthesis